MGISQPKLLAPEQLVPPHEGDGFEHVRVSVLVLDSSQVRGGCVIISRLDISMITSGKIGFRMRKKISAKTMKIPRLAIHGCICASGPSTPCAINRAALIIARPR